MKVMKFTVKEQHMQSNTETLKWPPPSHADILLWAQGLHNIKTYLHSYE